MQDVQEVLDTDTVIDAARIGRFQIMVAVFGALILFMDGFDTQVIGFITPQIARNWHLPHEALGPIFSSGIVGLLVGYLAVSPLSGRFGHKKVVIFSTALFGALTAATTLAHGATALIALRFLTGIGLGGALPSAVALTGEYFPKRLRSSVITIAYCGLSFGASAAGFTSAILLARFGWQSVLLAGGALPLVLVVLLIVAMPESLEYLVNRGHDRDKAVRLTLRLAPELAISDRTRLTAGGRATPKVAITQLFHERRSFGTLAIWLAMSMNAMVNYAMQSWLTTIFSDSGLKPETAITAATMLGIGGIAASFVIGPLMDRFGPYKVLAALFVAAAASVASIGLAISSTVAMIMASTLFAGFCTAGIQKSTQALGVYFYPTALRSTGVGWMLGISRIGAIVGPMAVGWLLGIHWIPASVFYVFGLPMLVGAVSIAVMGGHYAKAAKTVSVERYEDLRPTGT